MAFKKGWYCNCNPKAEKFYGNPDEPLRLRRITITKQETCVDCGYFAQYLRQDPKDLQKGNTNAR